MTQSDHSNQQNHTNLFHQPLPSNNLNNNNNNNNNNNLNNNSNNNNISNINRVSVPPLFSHYAPPVQAQYHQPPYHIYPHSNLDSLEQLNPSEISAYDQQNNYHPHHHSSNSFLHPFTNKDQNNSSSSWKHNTHLDEDEEIPNQIKNLNQLDKLNSPNHQTKKSNGKKKSPNPFNSFGYRQLTLVGLAALFLVISAVVIILVTHIKRGSNHDNNGDVDNANDITTESGLGSARNTTSDGLDPFNRADPNTNHGFPPDSGRRGGANGYDSLIVFGASYCDNAHARPSKLRYSLKPPPYFKGRWTNGYVWNEYLSAIVGPGGRPTTLVNYAFGGATVDNALNEAPVPDLQQQVTAFLSDLGAQSPGAGPSDGKSLIGIWVGINSVTKIWNAVLKQEASARSQTAVQEIMAQAQVNINSTVDEIFSVIASLINRNAFKNAPPDLMILPIPPVQLLIVNIKAAKGNVASLRTLGALNEMFNNRFTTQFNLLQQNILQQQSSSSTTGNLQQRLFTLDIPNIWKKFLEQPNSSNLTVVDQPCLTKLGTCSQPDSFLFWDTLHPTTHIHKQLALMMSDEINR